MTFARSVPFFNYPAMFAERSETYMATMHDVMARGAFIMQRDLLSFEEELAAYLGCRHAIGVADGTVALTLSLRAAGIGTGDEVIVSSHTFIATAAAVHHVGAIPVVCDCLPDAMMDTASAATLVTDNTRAIMPTQLNGRTFHDAVVDYAKTFTPPHKASLAVGRIKRAVQSGPEAGFGEGLAMERELQQLLFQSQDAKEGIAANLEKRKPVFEGK